MISTNVYRYRIDFFRKNVAFVALLLLSIARKTARQDVRAIYHRTVGGISWSSLSLEVLNARSIRREVQRED